MNYKTCNDCIHACVCKYKDEKVSLGTTVSEILHKCIDFEHKNDVERVVHCKDCSWAYKVDKYFIIL